MERTVASYDYASTPMAALGGSMRDFRVPSGADLLGRIEGFYRWQDARRQGGLWPFSRSTQTGPGATVSASDDSGRSMDGVNFASQDYLSLASHPAIKETAQEAIARYGVLRGLVRSADHIVMDQLAHACLQEGANAATRNIYQFRHLDTDHCRRWLSEIRAKDAENGVMVVTEGLFSMDSDTPNLVALQDLCHEYNATLVVDVAHDLGALGEDGRGHIGLQGMIGKIDLVMGSFSKTFASNGGFVACKNRAVKEYLRFYAPSTTFSNALSQAQAAVALKAFEIVESQEGVWRRAALMRNVLDLRAALRRSGLDYYGEPSAIVAVKMGGEALARLVSRQLPRLGLLANLVEYPAVGKGAARFRMQVMAGHTAQNIADAVERLAASVAIATQEYEMSKKPAQSAAAA